MNHWLAKMVGILPVASLACGFSLAVKAADLGTISGRWSVDLQSEKPMMLGVPDASAIFRQPEIWVVRASANNFSLIKLGKDRTGRTQQQQVPVGNVRFNGSQLSFATQERFEGYQVPGGMPMPSYIVTSEYFLRIGNPDHIEGQWQRETVYYGEGAVGGHMRVPDYGRLEMIRMPDREAPTLPRGTAPGMPMAPDSRSVVPVVPSVPPYVSPDAPASFCYGYCHWDYSKHECHCPRK